MQRQRRHKKLTDWGRQLLLQVARWLPDRQIIGVGDSSYAAISLLNAVRSRVCMITRLRARSAFSATLLPNRTST